MNQKENNLDLYKSNTSEDIKIEPIYWITTDKINPNISILKTKWWYTNINVPSSQTIVNWVCDLILNSVNKDENSLSINNNIITFNKWWTYIITISWYFSYGWWWSKRVIKTQVNWNVRFYNYWVPRDSWTYSLYTHIINVNKWDEVKFQLESDYTDDTNLQEWNNIEKIQIYLLSK